MRYPTLNIGSMSKTNDFPCIFTANSNITYVLLDFLSKSLLQKAHNSVDFQKSDISSDFLWIFKIFDVLERGSSALCIKFYVYLRNIPPSARSMRVPFFSSQIS